MLVSELLNNLTAQAGGAEAVFNKTRVAISRASDGEQVPSVSSSLLEDVRFGTKRGGQGASRSCPPSPKLGMSGGHATLAAL